MTWRRVTIWGNGEYSEGVHTPCWRMNPFLSRGMWCGRVGCWRRVWRRAWHRTVVRASRGVAGLRVLIVFRLLVFILDDDVEGALNLDAPGGALAPQLFPE